MNVVLTTCTNRKRVSPAPGLHASTLERRNVVEVGREWSARLAASEDRILASRLYAGRGFQEARATSAAINGRLVIVSAGLGLIPDNRPVPSYALSVVAGSEDNVLGRIEGRASPSDWWRTISRASPFGITLLDALECSADLVIVAMSNAYLSLVSEELTNLPTDMRLRLRIVTRADPKRIHPALHANVMPYDDRLDGPDSPLRGTRGDFAGRAARHFAQEIVARKGVGTAAEHASAVSHILAKWRLPAAIARTRHDDQTLLDLIHANWARAGGQSTRLLRVLRDELNVACEQGRFVDLMARARAERAASI